jgi:hypothetical protein
MYFLGMYWRWISVICVQGRLVNLQSGVRMCIFLGMYWSWNSVVCVQGRLVTGQSGV